jgi:hypothetical protein
MGSSRSRACVGSDPLLSCDFSVATVTTIGRPPESTVRDRTSPCLPAARGRWRRWHGGPRRRVGRYRRARPGPPSRMASRSLSARPSARAGGGQRPALPHLSRSECANVAPPYSRYRALTTAESGAGLAKALCTPLNASENGVPMVPSRSVDLHAARVRPRVMSSVPSQPSWLPSEWPFRIGRVDNGLGYLRASGVDVDQDGLPCGIAAAVWSAQPLDLRGLILERASVIAALRADHLPQNVLLGDLSPGPVGGLLKGRLGPARRARVGCHPATVSAIKGRIWRAGSTGSRRPDVCPQPGARCRLGGRPSECRALGLSRWSRPSSTSRPSPDETDPAARQGSDRATDPAAR